MYHVTLDYAKNYLEEIFERAKNELESCIETSELLKDPDLLNDIKQAREQYKQGETLTMEEIFNSNE